MELPSPAELSDFVRAMRDLGVVQAFGIVLGPEPTKLAKLEAEKRAAPPEKTAALDEEIARELREARIEAARQEVRDKLAATAREYTVEQIDSMIDPAVFR